MEPTKQDAKAMLEEAGAVQLAVRTRTPREHVLFFAWGLSLVLFGPMRDLGDDSVVGGFYQWIAMAVVVALFVTYLRQSRQVRVRSRSPKLLPAAFLVWGLATTELLPGLLDGSTDFAHSLAGVLAAVPLLLWAEWLRRNA